MNLVHNILKIVFISSLLAFQTKSQTLHSVPEIDREAFLHYKKLNASMKKFLNENHKDSAYFICQQYEEIVPKDSNNFYYHAALLSTYYFSLNQYDSAITSATKGLQWARNFKAYSQKAFLLEQLGN